jgi:hypothetical protein
MGAIMKCEEENWRDREESREFAVLEAAAGEARARVRSANLCMRRAWREGELGLYKGDV